MYYLLYQTTNLINCKIYVGVHQTEDLNDGYFGSGIALKAAIKKYGLENFIWDILKYCNDEDDMFEWEAKCVDETFVTRKDTYNMMTGGLGGRKLSIEARQNISKGRSNPSQATREKLRIAATGKTHSEETKKRISIVSSNPSLETRRKISEAGKGRIFSSEHKRKLSEVASKRTYSKETRLKMSLSAKARAKSNKNQSRK